MREKIRLQIPRGNLTTAQQMFNTGFSFHEAAIRCALPVEDGNGSKVTPTSPMIVCYAFACELYLKSLMTLDLGSAIQGHRLNVLFARLKSQTRMSVEQRLNALSATSPGDLDHFLPQLSAAFVDWRYIYEDAGGRTIAVNVLVDFCRALYAEIREREPSWEISAYLDDRLRAAPVEVITIVASGGGGVLVKGMAVTKGSASLRS